MLKPDSKMDAAVASYWTKTRSCDLFQEGFGVASGKLTNILL